MRGALTADEVDGALADLASATEQLLLAAKVADAEAIHASDAVEAMLKAAESNPNQLSANFRAELNPQRASLMLRDELATEVARLHLAAAREWASWWADLAALALVAAATDTPLHPVRAAAADPTVMFTDEDLRQLPRAGQADRELAGLTARMAGSASDPRHDADLVAMAQELAANAGLRLVPTNDGGILVKDDGDIEARRRRLWGGGLDRGSCAGLAVPGVPQGVADSSLRTR